MKTRTFLKTALAVSLLAVSLLAVSGASFANTVTAITPFSGFIGNTCTLTQTSAGVLAINPAAPTTQMGSVPAYGGGAVMGTITVACNTTGAVTIANPVAQGSAAQLVWGSATSSYGASVQLAGVDKAVITKGGTSTTSNISSGVYDVKVWLSDTSLPVGNYATIVTTTLVSN